jgi:hypothetical protein
MSHITKREILKISLLVIIAIIAMFASIYYSIPKKGDVIKIDCRLSEISPDIPIWAKQECRKKQLEMFDKQPK